MKFHKQLYRNDPGKGIHGDCQRTVLACLLDKRKVEQVPHFHHDNPDPHVFWQRVDAYLREQGCARFSVFFDGSIALRDVLLSVGLMNPGVYYMLAGCSPRGTQHVVICRDGSIVHDPHPDGGDVVAPGPDGQWGVDVLVPLRFTEWRQPGVLERARLAYVGWRYRARWLRYLGVDCAKRRGRSWNGKADRHWGPLTYSRGHEHYGLRVTSGHSGLHPRAQLSFGKGTLICELPRGTVRAWRKWVDTSRLQTYGPNGEPDALRPGAGYWDEHAREYGFSVHKSGAIGGGYDFLTVYLGPQTHDSSTTKDWTCFLPWMSWRHVRESMLAPNGLVWADIRSPKVPLFRTAARMAAYRQAMSEQRNAELELERLAPTRTYLIEDYDGEQVRATCRLVEREWRRGERWWAWLSVFYQPRVLRALEVKFSGETGRRKGSWKGGTLASYSPLPENMQGVGLLWAFRDYCAKHEMTLLGELPSEQVGAQ